MSWKDFLTTKTQSSLQEEIKGTLAERGAYKLAKNPSNAQLWVAIAKLAERLEQANAKIAQLEPKKPSPKKKMQDKMDLLESLEKL